MTTPIEPIGHDELTALLATWRQQLAAWRPDPVTHAETLDAATQTLLRQHAMRMETVAVWRLLDVLERQHLTLTALRAAHPEPSALINALEPAGVTHVCVTCGVTVPCPVRVVLDAPPRLMTNGYVADDYIEWDLPRADGSVEHGYFFDGVQTIRITPPRNPT